MLALTLCNARIRQADIKNLMPQPCGQFDRRAFAYFGSILSVAVTGAHLYKLAGKKTIVSGWPKQVCHHRGTLVVQ
jgi:hypothetical protein